MKKRGTEFSSWTDEAENNNDELFKLQMQLLPKFGPSWHRHNLVNLKVEALARILYYADLYKKIITVPGVICEFGVQWGATLSQLMNLRSIYEPFNHNRKIFGFDTFEGFTSIADNI